MVSARDIVFNLLGKETVSPAAKKAGDALEDLGDDAAKTARQAKKLDDEIEDLERSLHGLALAYAATGTAAERTDLAKSIRVDQRKLKQSLNIRKLMGDIGGDGAEGFSLSFAQRIGPLVAKAPLSPGLLAAVGAAVPIVVPAVTNMIALGAAGGAVALGTMISAKNPVVASGIASLKAELGDELSDAARPFGPAILRELDDVRAHFKSLRPDLDAVFDKASTYLDPLEDGFAGFIRGALPGFRQLVESAEPLVMVLREELPGLGEDFADIMKDVARAAAEGEDELRAMVDAVGLLVSTSGGLLPIFTEYNGLLEIYNQRVKEAADNGATWVEPTAEALKLAKFEAAGAADALRSFREEQDKLINDQLSLEEATIGWQEAIDDTAESLKDNGKTLDVHTAKGRANRQALLDQARAGLDYAQAVYDEKAALGDVAGAEKAAETAYRASRAALVKQAETFLGSKEKAEDYVTSILGIPPTRNTNADFTGDKKGVSDWKRTLSGIPREIFTKAEFRLINKADVAMALRLGRLSKGGPVEGPGPKGVDSELYMLAPGEHVLTAKEVEAAGGHKAVEQWRHRLVSPSAAPMLAQGAATTQVAAAPAVAPVDGRTLEALGDAIGRRLARDVAAALSGGTFRIDDRSARLTDLYVRGG